MARKFYLIEGRAATKSDPSERAELNFKFPFTDLGNAERLAARYGKEIRYCRAKGWLIYDGRYWRRDDTGRIYQLAQRTVREIAQESPHVTDTEARSRLINHARKSESHRALNAMVNLAQTLPTLTVEVKELDRDPWLFNVRNGTIDLRTGELRKHRHADLITKLSPVEYHGGAPCSLWHRFLERVQPEPEIRAFIQRLAGYALTGVIREHILPINLGSGRNGKSVFIDTLLHILADYAKQVPTELLMVKRGDAHPTERTVLDGCRLAAAVETEEGRALNVALVKQLTGGDRINARYMHRDYYEFEPTHKLVLSTNHRPAIRETKNAIWDRVLLIPWTVTIPEGEQDPELKDKLKSETPGILRWAVEGCLLWQRDGLNPPAAVRLATSEYREDQDFLAGFIDDCCELESAMWESASKLYRVYREWAEASGETPQSQRAFSERLLERGFDRKKTSGLKEYRGLRLKARAESAASD